MRLMIDLAQHSGAEAVTLKQISSRQEISIKYLEQIVTLLNRGGLIRSLRGNQGGYLLARAPKDYTIGEILRIAEGDLYPVTCMQERPNQCDHYSNCRTIHFWEGLYKVMDDYLNATTLEDLAGKETEENRWCYSI